MPATHIIISTHTMRHLRATLIGAAVQKPAPASITVSIDNDQPGVRALCREVSQELAVPILIASRPFPGEVRVGQVRNNGVRVLRQALSPPETDWLHFLDGDSVCPPGMLAAAERLREGHDLLIGGRILLTEKQTSAFDLASLVAGREPVELTPAQRQELASRHARYLRQQFLKRFGLAKPHKPKVLGANHACTLGMYRKVDGYDETFLGAWREDDDFGRRVHLAGGRARVAVQTVTVYHLWHPENPQKRENWSELPVTAGESPWLPRAGLTTPRPQADLTIERFGP
ncbi:MAG TPA: glycosyltransferase [Phycisphaerales bacterium]|nr:glycosyltransferase [Phycisphaerales bacterium]